MRFRQLDGNSPGFVRSPALEHATRVTGLAGSQSPVLNEAMARAKGLKNFNTAPGSLTYPSIANIATLAAAGISVSGTTLFTVAMSSYGNKDLVMPTTWKSSGKWTFEVVSHTFETRWLIGLTKDDRAANNGSYLGAGAGTALGWYAYDGSIYSNPASGVTGVPGWVQNDVLGVFIDLDAGKMRLYKNGSPVSALFNIPGWTAGSNWRPAVGDEGNTFNCSINYGAAPFSYPSVATDNGGNVGWYI